ncbi:MAG: 2Fe-2S iron-sulfur cluster-binding protein [Thalassotalea sp.]
MNTHTLKISKVESLTADSKAIYFEQDESVKKAIAGQFLTVILDVNDKEQRRSYSLFTTDQETNMGIGIKRVPGGIVSNYLNTYLKAGSELKVLGPAGNFMYKPQESTYRHLVLIAGGSGITPMMAILKTALSQTTDTKISMLYVNKSPNDIIFKDELNALAQAHSERFTLHHYLDSENQQTITVKKSGLAGMFGGKTQQQVPGFINAERAKPILDSFNIQGAAGVYTCGPGGLMALMEETMLAYGIAAKDFHKESFVPSTVVHPKPEFTPTHCDATVTINGEDKKFIIKPGISVLQAAIDSGIDLPYSCREGTCTACFGTCKSGEVGMLTDEALSDEELNQGAILPCVAFPKSKKLHLTIE